MLKIIAFFLIIVSLLICFMGCSSQSQTQLLIINSSSKSLGNVIWKGTSFGDIPQGQSKKCIVSSGSCSASVVLFDHTVYTDIITVNEGQCTTFTYTDNTLTYTAPPI